MNDTALQEAYSELADKALEFPGPGFAEGMVDGVAVIALSDRFIATTEPKAGPLPEGPTMIRGDGRYVKIFRK